MITLIEIDGFKTFQEFKLALSPFQVIVGVNSSGKSNFFDALRLLSRLAETDLRTAFQDLRGEAGELFTDTPQGTSSQMKFAVELFIDREVQDSWGAEATLKYTRLRYELHIQKRRDERNLERIYVTHESLEPIDRKRDHIWIARYLKDRKLQWLPKLTGGRSTPFISTSTEDTGNVTIALHQDSRSGRQASVAERVERTILSGVLNTEFPHAFAVREEMRSWRFLQLNPEVLRQPVSMHAPSTLTENGENLPSTLARLQNEDPFLLTDISRDLANLIPGILKIEVDEDTVRNLYTIVAHMQDGQTFTSRVLSDGTLRLLALATLKNDPNHRGTLCFEEPENGVHPFRLGQMTQILKDLATDFQDSEQCDFPLRQLLVNTHSPAFVSQPEVRHHLLFAQLVPRVDPQKGKQRVTRIVPVSEQHDMDEFLGISNEERIYTIDQAVKYLNEAPMQEAVDDLTKGKGGR